MDSPGDDSFGTYGVAQRDGYVLVTLRGRPRIGMVVSMFNDLEQLTTNDAELLVLIDETEMTARLFGASELRPMIDALKASRSLRERSRIAVCAPSPVVFGLNRMAQAFAGKSWEGRLEVFRTVDAARTWLLSHLGGRARDPRRST